MGHFSFSGAVLFNLHAMDLIDEIQNLLTDLNKIRTPLWQQMRTVEVLSAVLAEKLVAQGCVINLDPEEIKWPDGTLTKLPPPEKGKRRKKKPNPTSKNGVFGVIVHEYGGVGGRKNAEAEPRPVIVKPVAPSDGVDTAAATPQKRKKR